MTIETTGWKATRLESPADSSVWALFKKQEGNKQPNMHGYYHTKLDAISGSYAIEDIPEVLIICTKIVETI